MESPEFTSLPIILVSAKDQASATDLISEIIDNEPDYSSSNLSKNKSDRVWRLANKYYTADVRLHPLADGVELEAELRDLVEGHIIYLAQDEVSGASAAAAVRRRAGVGAGAGVRLAVGECVEEGAAGAAAAARGYALVPRRAGADAAAREPPGPARARAALHAHLWPNMRPAGRPPPHTDDDEDNSDCDSDTSWSSWQGAEEAEGAEGAGDAAGGAGFAAALDALQRGAALRPAAGAPRELRLQHAQSVLAALRAALAAPPPNSDHRQ